MHQLDNMAAVTDSELTVNNELYSQATHSNTLPYSTEGETPTGEYSVISEKEQLAGYSAIGDTAKTAKEEVTPTADNSVTTETQDTSIEGLVYSAVVRQDGKKTTVKTSIEIDSHQQQQQQPVADTSNEGLVYSAVVVKDGTKTTVKTTFFKD